LEVFLKKVFKLSSERKKRQPIVTVIMGSKNDYPVMSSAVKALKYFKIPHEVKVVSAHRTPELMQTYAMQLESRGFRVVIAGAGGAAHLPGMVSSLTTLPVIGVPIKVGKLHGLDAILSIVQMPKGVPVATMALDNAFNAGLLATRILAINDGKLRKQLYAFQRLQKLKSLKPLKI
jgi:phosphoribosylaminoimidazole carboxylase PurE protein